MIISLCSCFVMACGNSSDRLVARSICLAPRIFLVGMVERSMDWLMRIGGPFLLLNNSAPFVDYCDMSML